MYIEHSKPAEVENMSTILSKTMENKMFEKKSASMVHQPTYYM
jgi:hypothetical protein